MEKQLKGTFLLSILKILQEKPFFSADELANILLTSKNDVLTYLNILLNEGLVNKVQENFTAEQLQKIMIGVKAVESGYTIETVSRYLSWEDFERIVQTIFEFKGYKTMIRKRLRVEGKIFEVDILAFNENLCFCVDCKHWKHGLSRSRIDEITKKQSERAKLVSLTLRKIEKRVAKDSMVIPLIVTLAEVPYKTFNMVPLTPILKLKSFLEGIQGYLQNIVTFKVN
ncbi:MAG: restriction endonuclease [Candidatus Bathyarchaeota archaeon]